MPPRPRSTRDAAPWRLAFLLTKTALDGEREKFVRLLVLLLFVTLAVGSLILLLGPYPVTGLGLGLGTLAGHAWTRRWSLPADTTTPTR